MSSLKSLFNLIDRVVVITIPAATARQDLVSELFERHEVPFQFHFGRDCTASTVQELVEEGQYEPARRGQLGRPPLTATEIGCAISHRDVAAQIASEPDQKVLILEDDVQIIDRNLADFDRAVETCPSSWNLAYFGYQSMNLATPLGVRLKLLTYYPISKALGNTKHDPETIRRVYRRPLNSHWMHAGWFNGAHAYAIDRHAAAYIGRSQTPVSMEADLALNQMVRFSKLECICMKDPVIDQRWDIPSLIGARPSWKKG